MVITTKYLGPTNFKGARISCSVGNRRPIVVPFDPGSSLPFQQAAIKVATRLGEREVFRVDSFALPDNNSHAYVHIVRFEEE